MRLWFLLLTFLLSAISPDPAGAGTWPDEAADENGVIDCKGLSERDRRLHGKLDGLHTSIGAILQKDIRGAHADSLDSLEVESAARMRDLFLEARRA